MSVLGMIDQSKLDPGFTVAQHPSTNFTDVFAASVDSTARNYLTVSKQFFTGREDGANRERYKALTGRDLIDDAISAAPNADELRSLRARNIMPQKVNDAVNAHISNLKAQDPDKYKEVYTSTEIEERVKQKARESLVNQQNAQAGMPGLAGTAASLAGGVVAGFIDPVNLATLPLAAGSAAGILKTAVIEAGINAGAEVITQPVVAEWQKELGHEYGFKDMAENVAIAGLFGAAIGGGTKAISLGFGRAKSAAMAHLASKFDELDNVPALRAAQYEERRLHLQESNPAKLMEIEEPARTRSTEIGGPSDNFHAEMSKRHNEALKEVDAALNEGRPLNPNKLGISDEEMRGLKRSNMDEGLAKAHERITESAEPSPAKKPKDMIFSGGDEQFAAKRRKSKRLREHFEAVERGKAAAEAKVAPNEMFSAKDPEPPSLERQKQVEQLYDSPEWKAKEASNFDERYQGATDQRVFLDDGHEDVSVEDLRKHFKDDDAFLSAINTCGLGGG